MRDHFWQDMLMLAADMKSKHYVAALRTEFEAEGARSDEVAQLARLAATVGLDVDLKIGGAEAVRDLQEAANLGVSRIIAPMIESPYALQKFIQAAKRVFRNRLHQVKLLINIETITGCHALSDMLTMPEIAHLFGIVIGRVDLAGSMGLDRDAINSSAVLTAALNIAKLAKEKGLAVVMGGAITKEAFSFLKAFPTEQLDYLDTRKIALHYPSTDDQLSEAIQLATRFEWLWLQNKRHYYQALSIEDDNRIEMLTERFQCV